MTCRVILNADDFGLSTAVNEAVQQAHCDGVLTSASLLANGPALEDALAMVQDMPELGVGLHLALTEFEPLTHCPGLAPDGRFPRSHSQVFRRFLFGRQDPAQLRDELRAQIERLLEHGIAIDHVDGHGHVHLLPAVLEEVVPLCEEYRIPAIRLPRETNWDRRGSFGAKTKRGLLAGLCNQGEADLGRLRRPDAFYGLLGSGRMDTARLLAAAAVIDGTSGTAEIMVHPALRDEAAYPGYLGRQELDALLSDEAAAALPARITFAGLEEADQTE